MYTVTSHTHTPVMSVCPSRSHDVHRGAVCGRTTLSTVPGVYVHVTGRSGARVLLGYTGQQMRASRLAHVGHILVAILKLASARTQYPVGVLFAFISLQLSLDVAKIGRDGDGSTREFWVLEQTGIIVYCWVLYICKNKRYLLARSFYSIFLAFKMFCYCVS